MENCCFAPRTTASSPSPNPQKRNRVDGKSSFRGVAGQSFPTAKLETCYSFQRLAIETSEQRLPPLDLRSPVKSVLKKDSLYKDPIRKKRKRDKRSGNSKKVVFLEDHNKYYLIEPQNRSPINPFPWSPAHLRSNLTKERRRYFPLKVKSKKVNRVSRTGPRSKSKSVRNRKKSQSRDSLLPKRTVSPPGVRSSRPLAEIRGSLSSLDISDDEEPVLLSPRRPPRRVKSRLDLSSDGSPRQSPKRVKKSPKRGGTAKRAKRSLRKESTRRRNSQRRARPEILRIHPLDGERIKFSDIPRPGNNAWLQGESGSGDHLIETDPFEEVLRRNPQPSPKRLKRRLASQNLSVESPNAWQPLRRRNSVRRSQFYDPLDDNEEESNSEEDTTSSSPPPRAPAFGGEADVLSWSYEGQDPAPHSVNICRPHRRNSWYRHSYPFANEEDIIPSDELDFFLDAPVEQSLPPQRPKKPRTSGKSSGQRKSASSKNSRTKKKSKNSWIRLRRGGKQRTSNTKSRNPSRRQAHSKSKSSPKRNRKKSYRKSKTARNSSGAQPHLKQEDNDSSQEDLDVFLVKGSSSSSPSLTSSSSEVVRGVLYDIKVKKFQRSPALPPQFWWKDFTNPPHHPVHCRRHKRAGGQTPSRSHFFKGSSEKKTQRRKQLSQLDDLDEIVDNLEEYADPTCFKDPLFDEKVEVGALEVRGHQTRSPNLTPSEPEFRRELPKLEKQDPVLQKTNDKSDESYKGAGGISQSKKLLKNCVNRSRRRRLLHLSDLDAAVDRLEDYSDHMCIKQILFNENEAQPEETLFDQEEPKPLARLFSQADLSRRQLMPSGSTRRFQLQSPVPFQTSPILHAHPVHRPQRFKFPKVFLPGGGRKKFSQKTIILKQQMTSVIPWNSTTHTVTRNQFPLSPFSVNIPDPPSLLHQRQRN